jgi:hypothetical protein
LLWVFIYNALKRRQKLLQGLSLAGVCLGALTAYLVINDYWRKHVERAIDDAACRLGPDYARGGVEFYNKMLRRHIELRKLMPEGKGKKLYNLKGENYPPWIRDKHIPIAKRRENCREFLSKKPT